MDRKKALQHTDQIKFYDELQKLHQQLGLAFKEQYNRSLPFTEEAFDRWERAKQLGFGEGTSIYDSSFVFGNVKVGQNCWIGPFTIIDGSGELSIGNNCTISTGVHIYTHDNVLQTLSSSKIPIAHAPVYIGHNTYIGPQSILAKGITLGDFCVVAANSFLNKSYGDHSIIGGNPARKLGVVKPVNNGFEFEYFSKQ